MKRFLLITGFVLLFAAEILRVYFIMPFPGSQYNNTIDVAYWLNNNIWWIRILALVLLVFPLLSLFNNGKKWQKITVALFLIFYAVIFFFFNFRFEADKMFYQPGNKQFSSADDTTIHKDKLVIGVAINGEAKAYPIQLIGYHHQVRDTVGGTPVMVTYCTVCRTGRVYSPYVNGKPEIFRLVGMDHFNAMFEDATTKSWWQQATGIAVTGTLKGSSLPEIPSQQITLSGWLQEHPGSLVMQPDTVYKEKYKSLADYDKGTIEGDLEHRDSGSWKMKSWVIGVQQSDTAKAYDWNELLQKTVIQDSLPGLPLLLTAAKDSASFYVLNRRINGIVLHFKKENGTTLIDSNTSSLWALSGLCTEGESKGQQLKTVQAYQEFWHSWKTFHPGTKIYK